MFSKNSIDVLNTKGHTSQICHFCISDIRNLKTPLSFNACYKVYGVIKLCIHIFRLKQKELISLQQQMGLLTN